MLKRFLVFSLLFLFVGCNKKPTQNPPSNPPIAPPVVVQPTVPGDPKVEIGVVLKISTIIAEVLQADRAKLMPETLLNKLGADDLDTVEIVMEIEEKFDINISDSDAERLFGMNKAASEQKAVTIRQLAEFIVEQQKSQGNKPKLRPAVIE